MVWSHRLVELDCRPAKILVDNRFRSSVPVRELPRLAWFAIYGRLDPGGAFWHPDESTTLNTIEDDMIRLCQRFGRGWAVYVLRIDTRGVRENFFYFGGTGDLSAVLPSLRAAHPDYRIEYEERSDESWTRYKSCLANE